MSSFATARAPENDPSNGQQLRLVENPGEFVDGDAGTAAAPALSTQNVEEVARVEALLTQLEARSRALVPYGYGTLRESTPPRRSNNGPLALVLIGIWLSSLVLIVAYMKYVAHSPIFSEPAVAPPTIALAPDPEPQTTKVASSVNQLAQAVVTSSERLNQLQAAVERSNRDLQRIAGKVNTAPAAPKVVDDSLTTVTVPTAESAALPKNWHRVLEVKPTESAVAHKGADGSIDYWLVQRGADPSPSKVLPIGTSPDGVVVHNLEDGKDYTLTPSGEWRSASLSGPGN